MNSPRTLGLTLLLLVIPSLMFGFRSSILVATAAESTPEPVWVRTYDIRHSDHVRDMTIDMNGNTILSGTVIDRTWYTSRYTAIMRTDLNGNLTWSETYNMTTANAEAVAVDSKNDVVVAVTAGQYNDETEYHVIKYDANGTVKWIRTYDNGGVYPDIVTSMTIDSEDNIVIIGYVPGKYDPNNPDTDMCEKSVIIKYDVDGNVVWQKILWVWFTEGELAVDSRDNIILAGTKYRPLIDGGHYHGAAMDYYVSKMDQKGNVLWKRTYQSGNMSHAISGVAIDPNDSILVTGNNGTMKYSADGDLLWTMQVNGTDITLNEAGEILMLDNCTVRCFSPSGTPKWNRTCDFYPRSLMVDGNNDVLVAGDTDLVDYDWIWGKESSDFVLMKLGYTTVVPEFPMLMALPVLAAVSLLAVMRARIQPRSYSKP